MKVEEMIEIIVTGKMDYPGQIADIEGSLSGFYLNAG